LWPLPFLAYVISAISSMVNSFELDDILYSPDWISPKIIGRGYLKV
jgi:hypothetical protein